jgi:hypothetical protein
VFEEMAVKKQVLASLEEVVRPDCVLATNTSSLSVAEMAADLRHPERMVGFHFFNPVAVMPLVEVARAPHTDDAAYATAFAVGKQLGKSCVPVQDAPAFVVNRLLIRMLSEAFAAVDEGTPPEVVDAAVRPLGLPMSPLVLLQLVGPAVALHVLESLHTAFPDRFPVSVHAAGGRRSRPPRHLVVGRARQAVPVGGDAGAPARRRDSQHAGAGAGPGARRAGGGGPAPARRRGRGRPPRPRPLHDHGGGLAVPPRRAHPLLDREGYSERVAGRRFLPPGVASLPV